MHGDSPEYILAGGCADPELAFPSYVLHTTPEHILVTRYYPDADPEAEAYLPCMHEESYLDIYTRKLPRTTLAPTLSHNSFAELA